jgi:hypothetical protein
LRVSRLSHRQHCGSVACLTGSIAGQSPVSQAALRVSSLSHGQQCWSVACLTGSIEGQSPVSRQHCKSVACLTGSIAGQSPVSQAALRVSRLSHRQHCGSVACLAGSIAGQSPICSPSLMTKTCAVYYIMYKPHVYKSFPCTKLLFFWQKCPPRFPFSRLYSLKVNIYPRI